MTNVRPVIRCCVDGFHCK